LPYLRLPWWCGPSCGAKQTLHIVLDAAERLVAEPNLAFVVTGDGPEKKRLTERYGHLPNVKFLPLQAEDQLCELLNLADLHVLPQDRGVADLVLPSKLGGMLASGKPVLVTTDAGTELFDVLDGAAIIVPPGDTEALAREIIRAARKSVPSVSDGLRLAKIFCRKSNLDKFLANFYSVARPSINETAVSTLRRYISTLRRYR
jgi:colanic acid biosynthesis glycosyl transferase WcaI